MSSTSLPPAAYAASLASFPLMTVHRLLALLRHHPPAEAYEVAMGRVAPRQGSLIERVLREATVRDAWALGSRLRPPDEMWQRCTHLGLEVTVIGDPDHPRLLALDPLPPPVLFTRGDRSLLGGRRAALVGTRNATAVGRTLALRLGEGLAASDVHVVSGLARGIDGHAHTGAIAGASSGSGRPIAVVASGLDVVYPREHRALWAAVAQTGLLLSEWPPGADPLPHRFPLRNRLIAALSEVVVVVESRERGGSLVTASLAAERGIQVMAVPGSATNRAALGVNGLLRDGSAPVLGVEDVLVALSLDHRRAESLFVDQRVRPQGGDLDCYRVCDERASTVGMVAERTGRPLLDVAMSLARLELGGWLAHSDGWFERTGSPLA
ncbi:MAG: DNA-processing protein DprA [Ilumatobacteraceae bacterium]